MDRPELVPHKTLYFPDGDVALQSAAIPTAGESYIFRIHVSVVALRSRYFAAKLRGTPGSNLCDEYDGVPLITLPDAPENLEAILRVVYGMKLELPPRFNAEGYSDKFFRILAMARKYRFDEARADIIAFLEKDWPSTLDKLYIVQGEIKQLQAAVDNFADLDHEDDIDDPDLRTGPFRQVTANRLSDEDIDRAAMMAIVMSTLLDIPSICAAATYRLYVQAKFRTSYRRSGGMDQEAIRGPMTNELAKLASHLPDGALDDCPLERIATFVSFWVEKKLKRRCSKCAMEDERRPEVRKEATASIKEPLPPFVNLQVCETDPLFLLRSETLKYYRKYHPDDGSKYCQECYAVLKKEIRGWADRLWDGVFVKLHLNPFDVLQDILQDNDGPMNVKIFGSETDSLVSRMTGLSMASPLNPSTLPCVPPPTSHNTNRAESSRSAEPSRPAQPSRPSQVSRPAQASRATRATKAPRSTTVRPTHPTAPSTSRARPAGAPRPTGFWAPSPSPEASGSSQASPTKTSRPTAGRPIAPLPKRALPKSTPDEDVSVQFHESVHLAAASGRPVINLDAFVPDEQPSEEVDSDEDLYGGAPLRERSIPPDAWDY